MLLFVMDESSYSRLEPEIKVPDVRFPEPTDRINFYAESCKLAHANTVLGAAIKEVLLEKYSLQEKVQYLLEYIRRIEAQSKESKFAFK